MLLTIELLLPIFLASLSLLALTSDAGCVCSAMGDPHVVQCDSSTIDIMAAGQFRVFKTDTVEVQCTMAPSQDISTVDSCQINVNINGCEISFKDLGNGNPGKYKMYGQDMDKDAVNKEFAQLPASMKTKVNLVNGDEWIVTVDSGAQGIIKVNKITQGILIHAPGATQCSGLCGSCSGNVKPTDTVAFGKKYSTDAGVSGGGVPAVGPGKKCDGKSTPAPSSAAPTTVPPTKQASPAPSTKMATPAPTTPAPTTKGATPKPTTVAPTTKPTTSAPTTKPTTSSPTTKPTTPAPTNKTSTPVPTTPPPSPKYIPCDESKVIQHPVFESEEVMRDVIKQCLCGRDQDDLAKDKLFATFVEHCIYDKSLGVGGETAAQSTMEMFMKIDGMLSQTPSSSNSSSAVSPPKGESASSSSGSKAASSTSDSKSASSSGSKAATSSSVTSSSNGSKESSSTSSSPAVPSSSGASSASSSSATLASGSSAPKATSSSGSKAASSSSSESTPSSSGSKAASTSSSGEKATPPPKKLDTSMILTKSVTKPASKIPLNEGVTYQLKHTAKPPPSVPLQPYLLPRKQVFTGAGIPSTIPESEIAAMKHGKNNGNKKSKKRRRSAKKDSC